MADSLLQAELLAACSALGYSDGLKYHKEVDCLETVKDLIRFLRKDDDCHDIRRALGETKVLQNDLLPIIKFHSDDKELFDVTLRLLVNLTNPVLLIFKEELPDDKVTRQQYLQMFSQQQEFKEAFADKDVWSVLVGCLGKILEAENNDGDEDDKLVVERILILVRNVLAVAASPEDERRTDDDASVHDQVLWALHLANFQDLLLYIATSDSEQELSMHALEIISLMLKEQDPIQLAQSCIQRSQIEKEKDAQDLLEIRAREMIKKQEQMKRQCTSRHSRFGGTYSVKNLKSISDREIIAHKHIKDVNELQFDSLKRPRKTPKHRMPQLDTNIKRRSTLAIRMFLQEFCIEFLNGAYNSIMYIVKDNLDRARAQEHDESYYLWAIKFFLAFNRNHEFRVELIAESLNIQMFHYIQTQIDNYYEMMVVDKKKIPLWSRREHKALCAYQELLMTLLLMDSSKDESIKDSSKILKSKVFYIVEYREMLLVMLQNYDELKMTKTFLKDLVETVHIFLKLLEGSCKTQRHLIVQNKGKNRKKRKKKTNKGSNFPPSEVELTCMWDEIAEELLDIIIGDSGDLPLTIPYDPISEEPEENQKEKAMQNINKYLREKDLTRGLSLLRSSRDLWPEGDIFGLRIMEPSDELLCLRAIFMADIYNSVEAEQVNETETEDTDEDEKQENKEHQMSEQEFDYLDFLKRFCHIKVLRAYGKLFQTFFTNSDYTNHCMLRMFHRIAWDLKMPGVFFQVSMFRVFQHILDSPASPKKSIIDARAFIKFILRKFFECAKANDKIFVELLFWKTCVEAREIETGYQTHPATSKALKYVWTEQQESEVVALFQEFSTTDVESDKDIADLITENLINTDHNRRTVITKLKQLGLITNVKELSRKATRVKSKEWTEEEEINLRDLFSEHCDAIDPVTSIIDRLINKRPKNRVIEKILQLGLAQDRKELYKKRVKKDHSGIRKKSGNQSFGDLIDRYITDDESDENISEGVYSSRDSSPQRPIINDDIHATPSMIEDSLSTAIGQGQREAIDWLAELLEETANDREEDGDFEPIPILPISELCCKAMEENSFKEVLKLVGVVSPANHQEMFWRIPSTLSIIGLRKRALYLRKVLSGETLGSEIGFSNKVKIPKGSTDEKNKYHSNKKVKKTKAKFDDFLKDGSRDGRPGELHLRDIQNTLINSTKKRMLIPADDYVGKNVKEQGKRRRIVNDSESDDENISLSPNSQDSNLNMKANESYLNSQSLRLTESSADHTSDLPFRRREIIMQIDSDDENLGLNINSQISVNNKIDKFSPQKRIYDACISDDESKQLRRKESTNISDIGHQDDNINNHIIDSDEEIFTASRKVNRVIDDSDDD